MRVDGRPSAHLRDFAGVPKAFAVVDKRAFVCEAYMLQGM